MVFFSLVLQGYNKVKNQKFGVTEINHVNNSTSQVTAPAFHDRAYLQ